MQDWPGAKVCGPHQISCLNGSIIKHANLFVHSEFYIKCEQYQIWSRPVTCGCIPCERPGFSAQTGAGADTVRNALQGAWDWETCYVS